MIINTSLVIEWLQVELILLISKEHLIKNFYIPFTFPFLSQTIPFSSSSNLCHALLTLMASSSLITIVTYIHICMNM